MQWLDPETMARYYAEQLQLPLVEPDGIEIARGFVRMITRECLAFRTDEQILDSCRITLSYLPELTRSTPARATPTFPRGVGMWWEDGTRSGYRDMFAVFYFYVVSRYAR